MTRGYRYGIERDYDKKIGARVREERRRQSMPQKELGERVGVSFAQIQKYENGSNRIGAGKLLLIAEALQVPASHLFEDAREEIMITITERDLLHCFRALTHDLRKVISDLVSYLAQKQE